MKGPVDSTPDELDLIYENLAKEGGHLTREQLLAIDLRVYEKLAVYPNRGVDWSLQRKKILFLQEAVNLGYAWGGVVKFTQPYFGQSLPPPVAIPALTPIEPFIPPPFDSRKDPGDWAADCEKACSEYVADVLHQLREWQDKEIATGSLKRFERGRRAAGIAGQKKTAIANERQAMQWTAAVYFLSLSTPNPVSWAQLATWFPASAYNANPKVASAQKRRRADQIRKKVLADLKELGLPVRK